MRLTEHFTLDEFAVSASFPELVRPVPGPLIGNCLRLAKTLEVFRPLVGPMKILSGYRPPALNAAVEGEPGSQHLTAEACDVSVSDPRVLFEGMREAAEAGHLPDVGQVIWYPTRRFVHVALPGATYRTPSFFLHRPPRHRYRPVPLGRRGDQVIASA